ncbi:hypothetical protein MJ561_08415 [Klebsiella pneumoniae]|nr:hypothetical protein MJ561_08415 [Klebsiella pneumoniae]
MRRTTCGARRSDRRVDGGGTTEPLGGDLPLGDRSNLLFSGTTVSSGAGCDRGINGGDRASHINQMMAGIETPHAAAGANGTSWQSHLILILRDMAALFVFSPVRDMPSPN